jgi:hypothetical protein
LEACIARLGALPPAAVIGVIIPIFLGFSGRALFEESPVYDEIAYLPAGYSNAALGDFRMDPEHPLLLKLYAALPLFFQDVHLPAEGSSWKDGDQWAFGYRFFYQSGNRPGLLLISGRLMVLTWGLVLVISIYAVARERFGGLGGLVAFILAASCPSLIAHAHYVTMDLLVTTLMFLTVVAAERWIRQPSPWRAAQAGILLGGALLTKHSALFLLIVLPLFLTFGLVRRRRSLVPASPAGVSRTWVMICLSLLCWCGIPLFLIWSAYRFRYSPSYDDFAFPWDSLPPHDTMTGKLVNLARKGHLLPEAYLFGLSHVDAHTVTGHEAYALGHYSKTGWWWYFPFAVLVKTPVSELILLGWGMLSGFRRSPDDRLAHLMWLVWPATFGVFCIATKINIGIRYILPVIPFLIVLAGGILGLRECTGPWRRQRVIILGLATMGLLEGYFTAPHFLSYFNWPARLLAERHELLADSNLDWGQDLARLKEYLDANKIPKIKLSYFGSASPGDLGIRHQILPGFNLYSHFEPGEPESSSWRAGDWVAISATNLVGVYLPDKLFYQKLLRNLKPVATVGRSIYLYRIPADYDLRAPGP